MIIASRTQFHIERPWGQCLFSIVSLQCRKCESASRRFQPGEGPSWGLLRDCETDGSLYSTSLSRAGLWAAVGMVRSEYCLEHSWIMWTLDTNNPDNSSFFDSLSNTNNCKNKHDSAYLCQAMNKYGWKTQKQTKKPNPSKSIFIL